MITPTIGRVIWIYGRSHSAPKSSQPEPALISFVHNDRLINVGGFAASGLTFAHTSVALLQDGDETPHGIYATWMPFQIAAAKPVDPETLVPPVAPPVVNSAPPEQAPDSPFSDAANAVT